ncbi:hypothetical protein BKA70DRAFT_1445097 [Coprinopsis sp. MPI-PUGE-AT-0042]|nr:hypothetical protein BKA70DRAFT_1445097 [Coprinopsis sp. MPI-PUGE-AT-0042]
MAESALRSTLQLTTSSPPPSPPRPVARRLFQPSSSSLPPKPLSPLSPALEDFLRVATLGNGDPRSELERVECDIREELEELWQHYALLDQRIADLELLRTGNDRVADEVAELLAWREDAMDLADRLLAFLHQILVLLPRIRAALPFYAIIGAFFISAFVDLVVAVLGGPSSMLPLIVAFMALLVIERFLRS